MENCELACASYAGRYAFGDLIFVYSFGDLESGLDKTKLGRIGEDNEEKRLGLENCISRSGSDLCFCRVCEEKGGGKG